VTAEPARCRGVQAGYRVTRGPCRRRPRGGANGVPMRAALPAVLVFAAALAAAAAAGAAGTGASAAEVATPAKATAGPARFSITADNKAYEGFADVLKAMKGVPGGPGAFMISVGDFNPPADTRRRLDEAFGKSFPWYPVMGNHEADATSGSHPEDAAADEKRAEAGLPPKECMAYLRDYFDKHLADGVHPGPDGTRETTYSFDAGEVHVAVINEYWDGKTRRGSDAALKGNVIAPLRDWLKKDLHASRKPWKLVFGHEPAFPQDDRDWKGSRHSGSSLNAYKKDRDALWKVLEEEGAAAYVCGHTHRYSRYQPKGSRVWQIDAAQARNSKSSWKYDAFLIVTADRQSLRFDTYRSLKERGKFRLSDSLTLVAPAEEPAR